MKRPLFLLVLPLLAAHLPAKASLVGATRARACFEAALSRSAVRDGLRLCNTALEEEALAVSDRAATLVNRGILHMRSRDNARAMADYDEAIRIAPRTAEAFVNKGIALVRLDRHAEAVATLTKGIELGPVNPAVAHYSRALAYEDMGRLRDAYEDYGRAAALDPDWPDPGEQLRRFKLVRVKTAGA